MLRLADFFMRLEARLSYALIGLVQATGYAGGLDMVSYSAAALCTAFLSARRLKMQRNTAAPMMIA